MLVVADINNDLRVYNPATMTWFDLAGHALGTPPTARWSHGFTSAGGKLYVHGGCIGNAGAPPSPLFSLANSGARPGGFCCLERER